MSTCKAMVEIYGKEKRICGICGKETDALWSGEEFIQICWNCASEVLPKLMADAMANRVLSFPINKNLQISSFINNWKEAEKNYWYAVACQLLLKLHDAEDKHES